ncbi:acetamidase/formamidase family protein, partial [Rhodococcus qingshengii]|uniref:acetamidase/formamidase family protein n=1 Tax=Rhodococcus qingshengii TaxID=334542 RepID=UPI001C5D6072
RGDQASRTFILTPQDPLSRHYILCLIGSLPDRTHALRIRKSPFIGLSAKGTDQRYLDLTFAATNAVEQAIEYLGKFGYSSEQAYTIIPVAPCEMHVGGVVDIPNAAVTLKIPLDIFDKDILPS